MRSLLLKDPIVNYAVLEVARGGFLLRSGLGFDHCDVGIVTNVSADHLGLKGIHTVEQLARVKSVIPESVHQDGYAVLNADDDLVYAMRDQLHCQVALFSMDEHNPRSPDMPKMEDCPLSGKTVISPLAKASGSYESLKP